MKKALYDDDIEPYMSQKKYFYNSLKKKFKKKSEK